jgi:Short C-terminal domain
MRRLGYICSVLLLAVSIAGFITSVILNAFVFDEYDAYGEVPIPGTQTLHLPAGQVNVSFHTPITGQGGFLPIPQLGMTIDPPPGVAEPSVTENFGSTTTVNNDAHRRVWVVQVPEAGDYTIKTDGKASAFIDPRLAFGHGSSMGYLTWIFVGVFVFALVMLFGLVLTAGRARKVKQQNAIPVDPYVPTDEGVRMQQLKTLADLHASGALTDAEFESEKRRVLGS